MKKTISPDRVGRRHLATAYEKESVLSSELFKKHREPIRYPLDKPQDVIIKKSRVWGQTSN